MKYGIRLMPEIYEKLNPMPYGDAQYMEVDLAISLQKLGYAVWQKSIKTTFQKVPTQHCAAIYFQGPHEIYDANVI